MNRLLGMIGLCARAGRLVSGENATIQSIRSERAKCVLLDNEASKNGRKAVTDACVFHDVPLVILDNNTLGDAIGKPGRMAAAILDDGFAAQIIKLGNQPTNS